MSKKTIFLFFLLVFAQFYPVTIVSAADLILTGAIDGEYYSSTNISTQNDCYVGDTLSAILVAPTVTLNPGFHVAVGRTLSINADSDNDGLPDAWEMAQFGNLNQTADGDYDGDDITHYWEFALGLSGVIAEFDSDYDGMPDWYEVATYESLDHDISSGDCDCD